LFIVRFEAQVFGEELKTSIRGLFILGSKPSTAEMIFKPSARSYTTST
jgi:hypothetical protein